MITNKLGGQFKICYNFIIRIKLLIRQLMKSTRSIIFLLKQPIIYIALLISILLPLPTALADNPDLSIGITGKASWYDFKTGLFAASTIYPNGQKDRLHHIATKKFVDVIINDYGPDPQQHPDRVIDLQKEAFLQLATLGTGVISVRLEPLSDELTTTKLSTTSVMIVDKKVSQPARDLNKEKLALQQFTKKYGRLPKSSNDWQIIHQLAYLEVLNNNQTKPIEKKTDQSLRDLNKERLALQQFTKKYGRLPKNSADWQIIHQLAYLEKLSKTITDFQQLTVSGQDATAAIILDADNDQVLWQKNSSEILPIASLTKIIAVKTFLDTKPNLNKIVSYSQKDEAEISKYCKPSEAAMLRLKDGDQIKIQDLVYAALIGSANNAIESLVRISGLSRNEFINQMNNNAKKWGAVDTKLIEPTGLSTDNISTAKDYALILKNATQDAQIKKISTTVTYQFTTINTKQKHTIKNTNKLLSGGDFSLQSSKTGYLIEAGHCLAMAIQDKTTNQNFIVVTLGSPSWAKSYQTASQILTTALN
jgi:D-alanyl-D-alanine carboxypeptidase